MSYTKEQETIVLKVLSYKSHQYYEILSVQRSSTESDIKKSYRRLAVKLHPDKNPHPRASEAFKYLNKAWGVLSDPGKKKIFDQTGADPESRGGGFSNSTAAASGFGGQQFLNGFDPAFQNDIFNMFFGGGAPRGQTFSFGGNGFTFQSFGDEHPFGFGADAHRARQRHQARQPRQPQPEASAWDTMKQLLPILMILGATLFLAFFAEDTPEYSFAPSSKYNVQRATPNHKIPFFVSEKLLQETTDRKLLAFDYKVEQAYVQDRRSSCAREQVRRNELIEDAQGWFYTDQQKLHAAQHMEMPNCQRLRDLGLL